ncbi:MAG: ABC transporter substrate-binding protein [Clostridiales bacterium]|nr:ABC transporter substrate-binding protein [Clostridiales bacterium]
MKLQKITAFLLTLDLTATLLSGCGQSEGTDLNNGADTANVQSSTGSPEGSSQNNKTAQDDTGSFDEKDGDTRTVSDDDEEMAEINMVYFSMAAIPSGLAEVEAAINKITEPEINTHVTIEMLEMGSYEQQINLKISSGEKMDLMVTFPYGSPTFSNMASQKQLMNISGLLAEYGQGVLDTVGDFISATTVGDAIYGVTTYRTLNSNVYAVMRTDVLEDLGLLETAQNMSSFSDFEKILDAVKNSSQWNYLAGLVPSDSSGVILPIAGAYMDQDSFSEETSYDSLGDLYKIISINPDGSDPTVSLNFETPQYKAMIDRMQDWYDKGYIYKDSANQSESAESLVQSNSAFSFICSSEVGVETAKSQACGMEMTCVKILSLPITTSSCTKFVWAVPVTATEPEAAVKMMNLMYTDARIANLLTWGIEGRDYQVKDGIACYMDGQDANTCAYHTSDFVYGNQFLALPWEGQDADFRQTSMEDMLAAQASAYLGFSCDTSGIENELTAITNAINEYLPGLDSGISDDEQYSAFLEKLDKSGVQDVINVYQKQLDEWLQG